MLGLDAEWEDRERSCLEQLHAEPEVAVLDDAKEQLGRVLRLARTLVSLEPKRFGSARASSHRLAIEPRSHLFL